MLADIYVDRMSESSLHIEAAVQQFGTQAALADAAGVSQSAIAWALKRGRAGTTLAIAIERATKGKVTRSMLRPDIWPPSK